MRSSTLLGLSAAIVATVGIAGGAQAAYLNIIDPLNPTFTQALGINGASVVVGYGNATNFNGFSVTAPFASGNFVRENDPNAGTGGTQVVGIDAAGDTVGFYIDAGGTTHGFKNVGGTFTTVDQPTSVFNQLLGINQKGTEIAGYSSFTDPAGLTGQQAFSLSGSTYTNINALLPTNANSQATGVNNAGEVVGFYQDAAGNFSAFTDTSGSINSFEFPGSMSTQALGVNDLGEIVGDYVAGNGNMYGFLLNGSVFSTLDPFASTAVTANGINDQGRIVGFYVNADGSTIGFIGVPEPATLLVFASGLIALAAVGRRRT